MAKMIKNVVLTLLLVTLGASTAFLAYLHFFASEEGEISGEWTANLDMTKQASVAALGWLQEIEGVSVSLEDMEAYMQGLTIQVNLTFEQASRSEGTFYCNVVPESYDACEQAAYEAFAAAFQNLLAERLHMAGYTGSMDGEAIEELVTETFGMSTNAYLMSCAPALLPSLEDLQAQYDGSGTYEAAEDILTRQFDSGSVTTKAESYIRKGSSLVLSEEIGSVPAGFSSDDYPVIYTLKQSTDGAGREMP
ncbi:MAG: hypothetical protein K2N43_00810 [Lachnospiraceae bacterium]|nr:hypothetical protein [Lachnospiraceae bacterium]